MQDLHAYVQRPSIRVLPHEIGPTFETRRNLFETFQQVCRRLILDTGYDAAASQLIQEPEVFTIRLGENPSDTLRRALGLGRAALTEDRQREVWLHVQARNKEGYFFVDRSLQRRRALVRAWAVICRNAPDKRIQVKCQDALPHITL